jgi:membrane protein
VGFFMPGTEKNGEGRMPDWRNKLKRIWVFLSRGIWEIDAHELTRWRLFLLRQAQIASLVGRDFFADHCMLRASALTYSTLLSIVPLLALMFALLKGLGVQNVLEPIILERLAIGSEQIITAIIRYINNTNVGQLGAVGMVMLIIAVLTLLSNIEESFNYIWGVKETRTILRRFADYFSVVTIGPIFLIAAISMTTTLESQTFVKTLFGMAYVGEIIILLFKVLPFVVMWAAFTGLYIFMPNTRVNFRAALVGGILGGTLWQMAQWFYVSFQLGVSRYNAIYGTLAALPIFMVWIYVSWLIVLFGLEVTYACQNLRTLRREIRGRNVNFASRELVALTVLLVTAETFYRGEKPWGLERISAALELPPRLARSVLEELLRLGLLSEVQDGDGREPAYQPGRAPETVPIHEIIESLRADGINYTELRKTPEREVIREVERKISEAGRQSLEGMTLAELVHRMVRKRERLKKPLANENPDQDQ